MIDTKTVESPGWWADRLAKQMTARQPSLSSLASYLSGDAPLPEGAEGFREAYRQFQRKSRTNFAELVVEAVQERMSVTGFRVGEDSEVDSVAARIWSVNEMDTHSSEVHGDMLGLGEGFVIVGPPEDGYPLITREYPSLMVAEHDPLRPHKVVSALKVYRDGITSEDVAYLYLPGRVYVARKTAPADGVPNMLDIGGYEFTDEITLPEPVMPVVHFVNKHARSEFATHTDILDRINYMVLQRVVITAMQAYRQRAVIGSFPETDEAGNQIDYGSLFKPGPGAIWMLPEDGKMWESAATSLQDLLLAEKDDIIKLAGVTRTPLSMFLPDSQNQSAEGAVAQREGLIFKTEDRIKYATYGWNQVMQLALAFAGYGWQDDIETLWLPPQRLSLSERADASAKAQDLPFGTKLRKIWQFSETEAERIEQERMSDILSMALAAPVEQ